MKKTFFLFLILTAYAGNSVNAQDSSMSDKAKKNLASARAINQMFETNDFSKIGDYLAIDIVDHSAPSGEVRGLENIKELFKQYSGMMKDVKAEIKVQLANDNYVILWVQQSWTASVDDPMMQMKVGDHGTMESVEITKHNSDGKITDHWNFMSMNELMKMLPGLTNPQKKK